MPDLLICNFMITFMLLQQIMAQKDFVILNETVLPGESKTVNMEIARLHTMTKLKIPIIIERSRNDGPVVLFSAGLHGDEINGMEIVRQLIQQKINRPQAGTVICIPVINVFGFVNKSREFPDGRDLNRVFPGSRNGSLASRFAYFLLKEIIPYVDYCVDFHTGGASRFNYPQIRIAPGKPELKTLADVFNAPLTIYSRHITGSFRNSCDRLGVKMLLYEGGKSMDINNTVTSEGVEGAKRLLHYLNMLKPKRKVTEAARPTIYIEKSAWVRARYSGIFHKKINAGRFVKRGDIIACITDPFGKFEHDIKAPHAGYIINSNDAPIVYQGDAIFHISNEVGKIEKSL